MTAVVAPALWGLRRHARSTVVLVLAAAAGLAVALPVLAGAGDLRPVAIGARDWGIAWRPSAYGPDAAQHYALRQLTGLLTGGGIAVLLVTGLALVTTAIARASARRGEIAIRRAVGASRHMIAGAALVEGAVLVAAALGVGGLVAITGRAALTRAWPGTGAAEAATATGVAAAAVAAVLLAGALLPVAATGRRTPGAHTAPPAVPLLVPAVQFGLGLLVLVAAAQIDPRVGRTPARQLRGATASGTVWRVVAPPDARVPRAVRYATLLRRAHAESPATLVSVTSPGALLGLGMVDVALTDCGQCGRGQVLLRFLPAPVTHQLATADSFRAMGVAVLAGRTLSDDDDWEAPRVAVVSLSLAQRYFEGGRAVGRTINVGAPGAWYTVVGIVTDRRPASLGAGVQPGETVYLSALQHAAAPLEMLVGDSGVDVPRLAAGPGGAITIESPLPEPVLRARPGAAARWFGVVFRGVGWAALGIAVLGMVTVMHLWVQAVLPELALCRAVGARRRDVLGRVLARALAVAGGGAVFAWWLGPIVSDVLGRAYRGLPSWSLALIWRPALVLGIASLAAAFVPAWHAAHAAPASLQGRLNELA